MQRRNGFTLLELLVVIAILATIGGSLVVAYDGLDSKAAKGQATFTIAALDKAIRTYAVLNGRQPDRYDSLLFSAAGNGTDALALNALPAEVPQKLGPHALTAQGVAALAKAGITGLRYVDGTVAVDGASYDNGPGGTAVEIPNRVFDDPQTGYGALVALTPGVVVAAVENTLQPGFDGATPADSSRLRDMAGLDATRGHVVIALGIGNNATLVDKAGGRATLSEAPFYADLPPGRYGRFLALYHLASDADGDGTIDAGEYLERARFLGVVDTNGDWFDEEFAEFNGQQG